MIRVTLYENCILNETYKNVFSLETETGQTKNVLERYLDTLNHMTFEGDYIYYENSGELVIDYKLGQKNIYDYNYMKVEEFNDEDDTKILQRYCFIQDIALKNDCAYLTYEEDIWSSYANKIKGTTKSYLERSRLLTIVDNPNATWRYIDLHKLPIEYNGINTFNFVKFSDTSYIPVFVAFKLQWWEIESGEEINRQSDIFGFYCSGIGEAIQKIEKILFYMQEQAFNICPPYSGEFVKQKYYYEVSDFTILRQDFFDSFQVFAQTYFSPLYNNSDIYVPSPTRNSTLYFVGFIDSSSQIFGQTIMKLNDWQNELYNIKNYYIYKNFKNYAIGTLSQKFPLENIGKDFWVRMKLEMNRYTFNVMLDFQNQLVDITDSFIVEVPYSYINGSEMSALRLNKKIATINGITKIATGVIGVGLDVASGIGTGGISTFGEKATRVSTKIKSTTKSGNTKWRTVSKSVGGKASAVDIASENMGNVGKVVSGITDLMSVDIPFMNTSKGTFKDSNGLVNALYGLLLYRMDSQNDDYVNEMFNETGYQVYEFVNKDEIYYILFSNVYKQNNYNYNVLKFATCNVYGSFPRTIAENLNAILENGVKIWYDYQMQEDTLKVENYGNV